jgi:hypothetical protein
MILGQVLCGGEWVGSLEGKFSVSFGPKPGFRVSIWTWTKLNNTGGGNCLFQSWDGMETNSYFWRLFTLIMVVEDPMLQ